VKPAPQGLYEIPRGADGGPNGDAKCETDKGGIIAKKSAAPRLRKLSTALAGDAVAFM
jgi:hypothetical protein